MFEFIDTPNPNSKKLEIEHNYQVSNYLNSEDVEDERLLLIINHEYIKNIFCGPNFLTVTKEDGYSWEKIFQDLGIDS